MKYFGCSYVAIMLVIAPMVLSYGGPLGGYSKFKEPTEEARGILDSVRFEVMERLGFDCQSEGNPKDTCCNLEAACCKPTLQKFQTQVVAGTNYKMKVRICYEVVDVLIFVPLPYTELEPELQYVRLSDPKAKE